MATVAPRARASEQHEQPGEPRITGEAILYRLFDVGYEIHLDRVHDLLGSTGPERRTPVRGDAQAIQIANPPVTLSLGIEQVAIGDRSQNLQVSARIFDFGVISLRARLEIPRAPWTDFVSMGVAAG